MLALVSWPHTAIMMKEHKISIGELKEDFDLFQDYVKNNLIRLSDRDNGLQGQISGIERQIDDLAENKVGYEELNRLLQPIREALGLTQ